MRWVSGLLLATIAYLLALSILGHDIELPVCHSVCTMDEYLSDVAPGGEDNS